MMCHDVIVTMHHGGVSEEMSDLRVQLKMLEEKNTHYMQQQIEMEEVASACVFVWANVCVCVCVRVCECACACVGACSQCLPGWQCLPLVHLFDNTYEHD